MKKEKAKINVLFVITAIIAIIIISILMSKSETLKMSDKISEKLGDASDVIEIDVSDIAGGTEVSHDCSNYLINKYSENTETTVGKHWQECSVCGKHYNEVQHTFTETWAADIEGSGIAHCSEQNFLTRKCSCGYTIILRK